MSNDRENVALAAFVAGAVIGAAAGLLLAPASGQESRERVRRTANRLSGEAKVRARDAGDLLGRYSGDLREAVEAGRAAYRTAREKPPAVQAKKPASRRKATIEAV